MRSKIAILSACMALSACEVVDTGHRGIWREYGKITRDPLPEGIYYYNPITTSVHEISVRETKVEDSTGCFTRDTQKVRISFAMTYYPDPLKIHKIFESFGDDWAEKIVLPPTLGSIKDTIGKYVADDLVSKREEAKDAAEKEIMENLRKRDVIVTRLDFINLDFEDAYEKAVEEKVVAVQRASEAKNKTVEIEERAKQSVIAAQAEAESMKIRSQALSQNKSLVEYEAVQKWDGKLPVYMMSGSSVPFLNMK